MQLFWIGDAIYLLSLLSDRFHEGISVGVFFLFGGFWLHVAARHHPEGKKFSPARILRLFPELLFVVIFDPFMLGHYSPALLSAISLIHEDV